MLVVNLERSFEKHCKSIFLLMYKHIICIFCKACSFIFFFLKKKKDQHKQNAAPYFLFFYLYIFYLDF